MNQATRRAVRLRAKDVCEYCRLAEADSPVARLQIEHIVPQKHGGSDDLENLALACIDCNLHKGSNLTGIDPASGLIVELYNPRTQVWDEHFVRVGVRIEGRTDVGRTTVLVLSQNSDDRLQVRLAVKE